MTQSPAPGWYPDPAGSPAPRYWNGQQWAATTLPPRRARHGGIIVVSLIAAAVFAAGFVLVLVAIVLSLNTSDRQSRNVPAPTITNTSTFPPSSSFPPRPTPSLPFTQVPVPVVPPVVTVRPPG